MFLTLVLTLISMSAHAGEPKPPREVCFNLVCNFEGESPHDHYQGCTAASRFTKQVTDEGEETRDDSGHGDSPVLEVQCDHDTVYNSGSRRFTDVSGTRIQGRPGPYPAVILPPGSLSERPHHVEAALEFGEQTLRGTCFLYTGEP